MGGLRLHWAATGTTSGTPRTRTFLPALGLSGPPRPAEPDTQPPSIQPRAVGAAGEGPLATPPASSSSANDPDCYVEEIKRAPRPARMPPGVQLRNWQIWLTDGGFVQIEAGSRAEGKGLQCFFLAHALSVASEEDLQGSERNRASFLGGRARHNKGGTLHGPQDRARLEGLLPKG